MNKYDLFFLYAMLYNQGPWYGPKVNAGHFLVQHLTRIIDFTRPGDTISVRGIVTRINMHLGVLGKPLYYQTIVLGST